jgi:hypothetical protein
MLRADAASIARLRQLPSAIPPTLESLRVRERRNLELRQARRQIGYQRRLYLGDERLPLGRLGV